MNGKISVLVVDDQELFTQSIKTLIEKYADDIEVTGTASSGVEAIEKAELLRPNVILMDVRMPGMGGVEATGEILARLPQTRIMMLSTFDEDDYVREALHLGASGYLLKDISPTELIASIRALKEGAVQISPAIATRLVEQFYDKSRESPHKPQWFDSLSQREKEIFKMIARGYGNKQIAKELFIAEQTVRNYVSSIYSKLGIQDRFQVIQLANKLGSLE
jgi:DNA-binding NarL/FixJ family response regulator